MRENEGKPLTASMESGSSAPWWVKMPAERRTEVLCNAVLAAQELFKGCDAYEMLHDSFGMTDEELADIVPDLVREYGAQDEAPTMRMGG